jgi:regulator of RNase E activity RraA
VKRRERRKPTYERVRAACCSESGIEDLAAHAAMITRVVMTARYRADYLRRATADVIRVKAIEERPDGDVVVVEKGPNERAAADAAARLPVAAPGAAP